MLSSFLRMVAPAVFSLISFTSAASATHGYLPYKCSEFSVPVTVSANTLQLNITAPQNQIELTALVTELAYLNSTVTDEVTIGPASVDASYDIWSQLCVPDDFGSDGVLEFAIHGLGFDHTYWNFKNGSQYNYAEAALRAGHAIFMYDRLSVGNSSKPDGIKEVQIGTEIAVATALVGHLRIILSFGKIVGIGHSYGSAQMVGLAVQHGNLFDATVLMGASAFSGGLPAAFAAWDLKIASEIDPEKYQGLDSSYTLTPDATNDQIFYFAYPGFDIEIFNEAEGGKAPITIGQILTISRGFAVAQSYTNPVAVVTGDKDLPFCGGDCNAPVGDFPNVAAATGELFPVASNFSIYIPENTGHGLNMHLSAPESYRFIQQWLEEVL